MINDFMNLGVGKNISIALHEATKHLDHPKLIIFISDYNKFQETTQLLYSQYPDATVIGMSAYLYDSSDITKDFVAVWGFSSGIDFVAGIITDLDQYPIKHIQSFKSNVEQIKPNKDNTVCLAFTTNYQERLSTTLNSYLLQKGIDLVGGTPLKSDAEPAGGLVSLNGMVYSNTCAYVLIKNLNGKVKVYKENIYERIGDKMVITKIDPHTHEVLELNGKPAIDEYYRIIDKATNGTRENIVTNSLCKVVGDEEFTLAADFTTTGISLYKILNYNDIIYAVQLGDYKQIIHNTIRTIQSDFKHISSVFSVDCLYRYYALNAVHYIKPYINKLDTLGKHISCIGGGEQYKTQFVNQTMVCVVFE